jgi:hypothetical protein
VSDKKATDLDVSDIYNFVEKVAGICHQTILDINHRYRDIKLIVALPSIPQYSYSSD